ncbi:hypothetical protein DXG03_000606 [Asterophora parasitica]|uniref:Protein-S-isoprenylcysteine O-methyltransferase n=1 Tax=Asterophora parasitica TaxID=117018 RepID=A0A9P7G4W3_9AGAR|nr:hypothetical protein DXG03_000606 [Asterophora parasitica]
MLLTAARSAVVAPGLGRRAASSIALKYSKAVYGAALAQSPKTLDKVHADLANVANSITQQPEISSFLNNPTLSSTERTAALAKFFTKLDGAKKEPVSEITKNLLSVLSQNGRLGETQGVIEGFNELVAQYKGELDVIVTSATPLAKDVLARLETSLKQSEAGQKAKQLKLTNKVNPSVLGGIIVDFGDKTIDLSVQSRVTKLNSALQRFGFKVKTDAGHCKSKYRENMALLRIPCILVVMTGWHITTTAPQPPPLPEETLYASKFERFVKRRTGTYVLRSISWAFALAEFLVILASQAPSALVAQRILAALSHPFSPLNLNSSHNTAYKNIHLSTQCIAATLLAGLGGYIRYRCYRELGTLFTFQVAIRKDHRLVTTGPYGAVRHPGYAGVVIPICSKDVPSRVINEHIDSSCTKHLDASSQASSSSSQAPGTAPSKGAHIQRKSSGFSSSPIPMAPIFSQSHKKTAVTALSEIDAGPSTPANRSKRPLAADDSFGSGLSSSRPMAKRSRLNANLEAARPLAEKLRPDTVDEFVGQRHLMGPDSLLMRTLGSDSDSSGSFIFWGPPGCGKTTLARLIAKQTDSAFKELSATIVGIKEVREVFEEAKNTLALAGRKTILFLDEVHRFSKSQQDVFLPYLEQGYIQLIGATTENPSFKLTGALLSRCRVFVLERLSDDDIKTVLMKAVKRVGDSQTNDPEAASEPSSSQSTPRSSPNDDTDSDFKSRAFPQLTSKILSSIASLATGDARTAISLLELVIKSPKDIAEDALLTALKRSVSASYDRTGESHYDMISALHKSVRGSQGSAAMYWLARMLTAGEDPMFIARRMVVCASEDIGLADVHALPLAMAAMQACQLVGMPECRINLAHIVAYLSEAPKSTRAYEAYARAEAAAKHDLTIPVPMSMRNAPTGLMKDLGYGKTYLYNPDYAHPVHNTYLPIQFQGEKFLKEAGDVSDKTWDDEALSLWEHEDNGGKDWEAQPFNQYEVNPSWLAVRPLTNTVIPSGTASPVAVDDEVGFEESTALARPIHISTLEVPVSYEAVLAVTPGLHATPPILPESAALVSPPPPQGYDFIFHIGVAGRGPLRMERQGHKLGYHMKDADGKLASVARSLPKDFSRNRAEDMLVAENLERERLGMEVVESIGDTVVRPTRGFGAAYENFPDEILTEIDVTRLVQDLKRSGIEQIYTSMDAGHYLCDFIYYCSLAESKRSANPYERRRNTQVLFLHCPPADQPLSTEEVTEAIRRIIVWVCKEIQLQIEADDTEDQKELLKGNSN